MDIILHGQHQGAELSESITHVLTLFKERYKVDQFCEIHLSVTLIDSHNDIVELVDSQSNQAYRTFEVYRDEAELAGQKGTPLLQLVVDNTR